MIPLLRPLADKAGLLDTPGERKTHQGSIPLIGGFAIFSGISLSIILNQNLAPHHFTYLLCAALTVLVGILDDLFTLSARFRLLFQVALTALIYFGAGLHLESFGNLLGWGSLELGAFSSVVSVCAIIGSINAFNMFDGIDGLAGTNAIISFSALAVLFGLAGQERELLVAIIFIAALIPYLAYNLTIAPFKKKIFMGDAGSMLIGLTIVWLFLHGSQQITSPQSFRPVTALWVIALPLADMASIMIRRIQEGRSPFSADRNHLHHILLRAGFSDRQTLVMLSVLSLVLTSIGLLGEWLNIPEVAMFLCFLLFFALYHRTLLHNAHLAEWAMQKFDPKGSS